MALDGTGDAKGDRRERIAQLVLCRTKLTTREALLLREVFPEIVKAHHAQVVNQLRRRGLAREDFEDLYQESFITLRDHLVERGFPNKMPALLHTITDWVLATHLQRKRRAPPSTCLPTSSSERPPSTPDVEHALAMRERAHQLLSRLSPEHREVVEKVLMNERTHEAAAAELDIPEGTVKSRLLAAKRELLVLAALHLPESQRGPE